MGVVVNKLGGCEAIVGEVPIPPAPCGVKLCSLYRDPIYCTRNFTEIHSDMPAIACHYLSIHRVLRQGRAYPLGLS